jgi:hypothetical protein
MPPQAPRRAFRGALVEPPLAESGSLIYGELGVCAGVPLGTPCDAL